jgi:hypothetical protein
MNRGPRDHPEAIIYMSRATLRKTKGAAGWPGSWQAGLASGGPLAHRDHGPDGPDGPEGVEPPFLPPRGPSRASGGRSAAGTGSPLGTISAHGPDIGFGGTPDHERRAFGGDLRLARLWFAHAFDSTGCGLATPTFRPSYIAPVPAAVAAPWLPSWFQLCPHRRSSEPLRGLPGTSGRKRDHGNNCWRRLAVFFVLL